MDNTVKQQMQMELFLTLITTLLFLVMYWWSTLPEWKREAVIMDLKHRIKVRPIGGLSLADRLALEQFRAEISRWEHARKRDNGLGPRDNNEKGN